MPQGLLRQLKLHSPFATLRARVMLAAWALCTAGILAAIFMADLDRTRDELEKLGRGFLQHVSDRALVSETAIEGFGAFVASMDEFEPAKAEAYANRLLNRYPFLYMFEVAERIPHAQREATERLLGLRYPGFQIKRFTYESDRSWVPIEPADYYYPIIFQQPFFDDGDNIVGLDIHASDLLKNAMETSFERGEPVATHPFDLAEGDRGYVLHRPVQYLAGQPPSAFEAPAYVLLALKSNTLFSELESRPERMAVRLAHREIDLDQEHCNVLVLPAAAASASEVLLLPRFQAQHALDLSSQPFLLGVEWQLGWGDLSLGYMVGVVFASLLIFLAVRTYAEHYIRSEFQALENEGRLYELANFDSLTGLANRSHLMDFLESALARAQRHRHQLVILFIDVDGFKEINDTYGHNTGDLVLEKVASRLSQELREDELLARFGGDEFVWVSADSEEVVVVDSLISRLKHKFDQPIIAKKTEFRVTISIGSAVYPKDGRNITALFEVADRAMYRDKRDTPPDL